MGHGAHAYLSVDGGGWSRGRSRCPFADQQITTYVCPGENIESRWIPHFLGGCCSLSTGYLVGGTRVANYTKYI